MNQSYDVCIIGAGASGLAAANILDPALHICIIEKNGIPGRKIAVTGGGRCNLTNRACSRHDMTLDLFRGLGLETRCDEEGRYYPYSMVAGDVVKSLIRGLENRKTDWRFEERLTGIRQNEDGGYTIETDKGQIHASTVLLCLGGKAAPKTGTTGDGYAIARSLGHTVTRTYPILTGIKVDIPAGVSGIRARGEVSLIEDGKVVRTERGEIQFTDDGISGICVFDLTPYIKIRPDESPEEGLGRFAVAIDFAPDMSREDLASRTDSFGILTGPLADWIPPAEIKNTVLPIKGVWGWDKAQCTAGGVSTEEIDEKTMESTICPGLYFAGELMDVQGPCGGYNLQHAWESGILAARGINESFAKAGDEGPAKATDEPSTAAPER